MLLSEYLERTGKTKAGISRELDLSASAISQWKDIPEKWEKVLDGGWAVHKGRLYWQGSTFGHGSEWDYNYSPAKIFHIRRLLEELGSVQAVWEWVQPIAFERDFIQAVKDDVVCPIVVDASKERVYPFGES